MGRTACTEPQCLYSRAIPLLPLWAIRPVQSLSACTVELRLYSPYGPYGLYKCAPSSFTFIQNVILVDRNNLCGCHIKMNISTDHKLKNSQGRNCRHLSLRARLQGLTGTDWLFIPRQTTTIYKLWLTVMVFTLINAQPRLYRLFCTVIKRKFT